MGLNRDIIKYIAMLTMLLNHISHIFLPEDSFLGIFMTDVGYFTAITMCYFLVEGYSYTSSKKKYGMRMLLFALISQIPFTIALQSTRLNMMFTLLFCFLILVSMEKIKQPILKILAVIGLVLLCTICDWSWKAALFTLLFAVLKDSKQKLTIAYFVSWFIFFMYGLIDKPLIMSLCASMGIALSGVTMICLYNGKRAEWGQAFSKWFFYLFYPGHLLALWFIQQLIC